MPKVNSWTLFQGTFNSPAALSLWGAWIGTHKIEVRYPSGTEPYSFEISKCYRSLPGLQDCSNNLAHRLLEAALEAFSITDEDPLFVNIARRKLVIHVLP